MYRKVRCTCEVVVLLIKPNVFLTFSLSSASLDLKVPIVSATEGETLLEVAAYVILIKYFVFYRPSGKLLWKKVEDFLISNP